MNNSNSYDPEDLELLLQSKTFSELLPEEKAFVLQHVDNDAEYDSMRATFLNLEKLPELDPVILPQPSTKEALLEAFSAVHSTGASEEEENSKLGAWWLWFWDTNKSIFSRPAFQLASIGLVLSLGIYVVNFNTDNTVAELKETLKKTEEPKEKVSKTAQPDSKDKLFKKEVNSDLNEINNNGINQKLLSEVKAPLAVEENEQIMDQVEIEEQLEIVEELEIKGDNEVLDDMAADVVVIDGDVPSIQNTFEDANYSFTPTPEVILEDITNSKAIYTDSRLAQGNSSVEAISNEVFFDLENKKESDKVKTTPALKASEFSELLAVLHTAE